MNPEWNRVLILLATLTLAWNGVGLTQAQPPIQVRGFVKSGTDGTPVEGAKVTLIRRVLTGQEISRESAVTDAHGAFVLKAPSPGDYSISASILPWAFGEYGRVPGSQAPQKWFTVSGPTSGIVVELWQVPTVAGSVFDENDEPLPRTFLQAMRMTTLGGRPVLRSSSGGNSGPDGKYSLRIISPGTYLILAFPSVPLAGPARRTLFFPDAQSASAARPMQLAMGQSVRGTNFHIRREDGWTVSGVVQLPNDVAGPASLELFDVASQELPVDWPVARASIGPTGRFAFPPVARGSYEIRFVRYPETSSTAVRDGQTWWIAEPVNVRDADVAVQLHLKSGIRLAGQVVFDGPGPRPEPASLPKLAIRLRSIDYQFFAALPACAPREDGRFRTVQVPPGRYVLGMTDQIEGYRLLSVKIGGRETAGVAFDLTQDVGDVVLTLSSRQTAVGGQVSGEAGRNRSVLIWPEDEALWTATGTQLGRIQRILSSTGSYRAPVFPGNYRIAALDGPTQGDWESPAFLRSLIPVSEKVIVLAGQTVSVNLKAAPVK